MAMSNKSDLAVFYPFEKHLVSAPEPNERILMINTAYNEAVLQFENKNIRAQQFSKAQADILENKNIRLYGEEDKDKFDYILISAPRQIEEIKFFIARALTQIADKGTIIIAAANKAGGMRLSKIVKECGLKFHTCSKFKSQILVIHPEGKDLRSSPESDWLKYGEIKLQSHGYYSCPGIYGWEKIDRGSELLISSLEQQSFSGHGADFGCGYGYLTISLLERNQNIKSITAIDDDQRAVMACSENIKQRNFENRAKALWQDIRNPGVGGQKFEWIIMNPPFHNEKKLDIALGISFIKSASDHLRPGGQLYMVANTHLPYEPELAKEFSFNKLHEGGGFKVFCAKKKV
jgi:16S rRNA (guanine1207-N2)-methyltransferase